MNRKTKYIILVVSLLTVLAAIMVSLSGRLGEGEETAEETPSPEPETFVTDAPKPSPPAPPSAPDPVTPPDAPEAESTPEPENDIHAVAVTAGPGGTVEPRGLVSVRAGESVSFTFTPDEGFEVAEVKVDGRAVVSPAGYVFSNVRDSHTLYVVFRATAPAPEPTEEPADTPDPEPSESPEPVETGEPEDVVSGFLG